MPDALRAAASPIALMVAHDDEPSGIRLRKAADLVRVRFQVYAPADAWRALRPWERYVARVHAYALVAPDAIFALESAAALMGLPVFGEPRDVHVFDVDRSSSTRYGDVVVHTSRNAPAIELRDGIALTTALHTAVGLGRVLPPAFGLAVCDAYARHLGDADALAAFGALARTQVSPRGRRRLQWLHRRTDPGSESAGESVSRAVIEWLGFDDPEVQHEFRHEGKLDRADFFWLRDRVVGESDGYGKYDAPSPREMESRLTEEKIREDRLRRYVNGFARWDWSDTLRANPLDSKLRRAGLNARHPVNAPALVTLRRNPRSL